MERSAFQHGEMHEVRMRVLSDEGYSIAPAELRSEFGRRGARAKLKDDPKQIAKAQIKQEFEAWQRGEVVYKNGSDFARKMEAKFDVTFKSVEGWLPEWRRAWTRDS